MNLTNKFVAAILILCMTLLSCKAEVYAASGDQEEQEVRAFLDKLYKQRADILVSRETDGLKELYLHDNKVSKHALHNEVNRTNYLNEWAIKRAIKLLKANSEIRIVRLRTSKDTAKISLVHSLKVDYTYTNKNVPVQSFGIGTEHYLTLKKLDDDWKVHKEWYLDPLDENPNKIAVTDDGTSPSVNYRQQPVDGKNTAGPVPWSMRINMREQPGAPAIITGITANMPITPARAAIVPISLHRRLATKKKAEGCR